MFRNPNGSPSDRIKDWPVYMYPERAHIVLDVGNKSTGVAHRADYCAFWGNYVPLLLEESGEQFDHDFILSDELLCQCL